MLDVTIQLISESCYVTIPLVSLYVLRYKKERFVALMLAVALSILIALAAKSAIGAPRPCAALGPELCEDPYQSFPSSHTALVAAPLIFLLPELPLLFLYLGYVFLVGFSRVAMNAHYPHDILGGALLGIGVGYVFFSVRNRLPVFGYENLQKLLKGKHLRGKYGKNTKK